jgi:hypothetical protein
MKRTPELDVQQVIHLGALCTELHCLPGPGGILQQDSLHVWLLTIYLDALKERDQKEAERSEAQAKKSRR